MFNKINGAYLLFILFLFVTSFTLLKQNEKLKKERDIYQGNSDALLSDIKRLRVDSVTSALDVKTLCLTVEEYKRYRSEDAEKIKKLGIKLNDLQMVAKHNLEINAPLEAELKDSVFVRDSLPVKVKTVEMNNPYIKISAVIKDNHLSGNIHLPVNLQQAVWIEPKHRFLFWRWGTKAVHQTVSSDNPYVEIKYSEVIEVRR